MLTAVIIGGSSLVIAGCFLLRPAVETAVVCLLGGLIAIGLADKTSLRDSDAKWVLAVVLAVPASFIVWLSSLILEAGSLWVLAFCAIIAMGWIVSPVRPTE